ncbi:Hypothetical Protein FCC1311_074402 [Hondaea fermentalgiana]|uniref:Ska2 N-terminal domain-containing protein n=1 Tax=Hondaea fermentalgiana TaxID=2315210 RepID=A0A2R5GLM8_9STRA|nr:Hypothetical Protein FCC1311_074402 [Hondaea fermentalgiana]|eukprot:GBG31219.1 Hypothetical Protein FCC1311_074402 [Hondaea fermentalgiana]
MEIISVQEKRLEDTREVLRKALEPSYGANDKNPVVLLDRLARLQRRCVKVQERVQKLTKVKQELVDELFTQNWQVNEAARSAQVGQGNAVADALEGLATSGEPADALEAARDAQGRINELLEASQASWKDYFITPATQAELSANVIASRVDLDVAVRTVQGAGLESDSLPDAKQASKEGREHHHHHQQQQQQQHDEPKSPLEVSPEAFAALPDSIRGRARLSDVQRTLEIIISHAGKATSKRSGRGGKGRAPRPGASPPAMSIKELDALGAKVVGHTGACVLQCLRSLGLVDISRDGVQLK